MALPEGVGAGAGVLTSSMDPRLEEGAGVGTCEGAGPGVGPWDGVGPGVGVEGVGAGVVDPAGKAEAAISHVGQRRASNLLKCRCSL